MKKLDASFLLAGVDKCFRVIVIGYLLK